MRLSCRRGTGESPWCTGGYASVHHPPICTLHIFLLFPEYCQKGVYFGALILSRRRPVGGCTRLHVTAPRSLVWCDELLAPLCVTSMSCLEHCHQVISGSLSDCWQGIRSVHTSHVGSGKWECSGRRMMPAIFTAGSVLYAKSGIQMTAKTPCLRACFLHTVAQRHHVRKLDTRAPASNWPMGQLRGWPRAIFAAQQSGTTHR